MYAMLIDLRKKWELTGTISKKKKYKIMNLPQLFKIF